MTSPAPMTSNVETPSGKSAAGENFPVGSWFIRRRLRPHVARFYAFARAIDDIADNPDLAPDDKIARLDAMADALEGAHEGDSGFVKAHRIGESLAETGVTTRHCHDLIAAFKQDSVKPRYRNWGELMGYCYLSAAPVGRYLLDLHGEDRAAWPASDALCNALQIINHLQDCQDDYRQLDRVYLPLDWMDGAGVPVEALDAPKASPGLRKVLDQTLDGIAGLLVLARKLPGELRSLGLATESSIIVAIAERLTAHLGRRDPLAGRVVLTSAGVGLCGAQGVLRTLAGRLNPAKSLPKLD
ncbi:MAG: squalene synthase HpnC [Proteobacteria bacterium]|nr:squalene synthase HpnC [Pseudomonadota bacterium]